jgi:PadR family transcriptional regulator AphA
VELSTNELTVLALVTEQPSHGWSLASRLARGGEIGNVWSVSRPSVYHALGALERQEQIAAVGLERGGRGPHRVIYAATEPGSAAVREWLLTPVEHVRDVRSLLLLKVVLVERMDLELEQLLVAQRAVLVPFVHWLDAKLDDASDEVPGEHAVAAFRLETATAVLRFIDGVLDRSGPGLPALRSASGSGWAALLGRGRR